MKLECLLVVVAVLFVAGVLTASSYAKIDPGTCAGIWLFDEDGGDIAIDSSENMNDGELQKGSKWEEGIFGNALELDGANHYVNAGDPENGSLDFGTGDFTILGWLKHDTTASTRGVANKRNWAASNNAGFQTQLQTGDKLHIYFCDGSAARLTGSSGSVFADNSWHHFALVFDRDQELTIYRDGVVDGSLDISDQQKSISNDRNFYIGACDGGDPGLFFSGLIDEFGMFKVALAAGDIQAVMNKGLLEACSLAPVDHAGKLTTTWATVKVR